MRDYITDLVTVSVLVIGLTALMGPISQAIGEKIFGGKKKSEFNDMSKKMHANWKSVGGNKKYKTF